MLGLIHTSSTRVFVKFPMARFLQSTLLLHQRHLMGETMNFVLTQALRGLRRDLGANLLVIAVLSVGIASVMIMFNFVKVMVIDAPPFANAAQAVKIGYAVQDSQNLQAPSGADLLEWQRALLPLGKVAGISGATVNLSDDVRPERFDGAFVTGDLFSLLGVAPVLGRSFTSSDFAPDVAPVMMISYALWQNRYAGDPKIIGRATRANGKPVQMIGVMPQDFTFPKSEQLWLARGLSSKTADLESDYESFFLANSSADKDSGVAHLNAWLQNAQRTALGDAAILFRKNQLSVLTSSLTFADADTKKLLGIMLAGVVLLMLVACGNSASVMLVRVLSQSAEQTVQLALGSGFWRLAMNIVLQTLILALISAGIAAALAIFGGRFLLAQLGPDILPAYLQFGGVATTIAWSMALCVIAALITLALPLHHLKRAINQGALHQSARGVVGRGAGQWLIALQVALSCAVLVNTFVVVRIVQSLEKTSLGIDEAPLLTGRIALFEASYPTQDAVNNFVASLQRQLQAIPGVAAASLNSVLPGDLGDSEQVLFHGDDPTQAINVFAGAFDPYFTDAYGVKLLTGRFFDARDRADTESVVVIDEHAASQLGGPTKALGQTIVRVSEGNVSEGGQKSTVIGVVNTLRLDEIDDRRDMTVLAPMSQKNERFFSIALRAQAGINPASLKAAMQQVVAQADSDMPVYWLRTYPEIRKDTMASERVLSTIFSGMGLIALLLSATGLYGLVAFLANQRAREFGVRRALGAQTFAVMRALLGRTSLQVFAGIALGLGVGVPVATELQNIFRGEAALILAVFGTAACLLLMMVLASIMPTRRALAVLPQVALRSK